MVTDAFSDAAFRAVVEEAPDAIVLVSQDGRIAYVNTHAEDLFGYVRSELIGQRVEMLIPEDRRSMHVIDREVYQERPERRRMGSGLDLSGRRKDGSTFPVEISLSPFHDEGITSSMAVVRDVTRQRRAEEALRRSEERHRLLNERAENVVFRYRLTPPAGFEYVSASVGTHLGYTPEQFYVAPDLLIQIAHEDDRHLAQEAFTAAAPANISLRLRSLSSGVRWFEWSSTKVRGADGSIIALEGIARDVTARRAADEERLQLQSEIERQLDRNRIAGDLHDDIIQSIYALGLGLHAVRDDSGMTKEMVIDQTTAGLNQVIGKLRSYMQELSGDVTEDEPREPLVAQIHELIASASGTDWVLDIQPLDLRPDLERQVFLLVKELVSNVQRHSQARSAEIRLRPHDEGQLVLEVNDDGLGFERQRVGEDSFGLRSVEARAASIGATLSIDSAPGHGARTRITFPAAVLAPSNTA